MSEQDQENKQDKPKRKAGRPPKLVPPERIPDTPENIAKALLRTSPDKLQNWREAQARE